MMKIPLSGGLFAVVDDEDYATLSAWSWSARPVKSALGGFYAARSLKVGGRSTTIYMHRQILNAAPGVEVDHRDADGLNNRRSNLRTCTKSQNNANRRLKRPASGFRGVYYHPSNDSWCAMLYVGGVAQYLGSNKDPAAAARIYDAKAAEVFGAFAQLNFPAVA